MVLCGVRWLFQCFSGWRKIAVGTSAHRMFRPSSKLCAATSIASDVRRMIFEHSASSWGTQEEEAGIVGNIFALVIAIMAVVFRNIKNLKFSLFLVKQEKYHDLFTQIIVLNTYY